MDIPEYDIVRIVPDMAAYRVDKSASGSFSKICDLVAVVLAHAIEPDLGPAFIA